MLKTAEEMYQYCVDNKMGVAPIKSIGIAHFRLIVEDLQPGEEVQCTFIGLHNYKSITKADNNFAYAVTNKRIIMAQKKPLGSVCQSVNLANVDAITKGKTGLYGTVRIDTTRESFNVGVHWTFVDNVYKAVTNAWHIYEDQQHNNKVASATVTQVVEKSAAEQIKEMKGLLDEGIITQEEFDLKKKQLLGL